MGRVNILKRIGITVWLITETSAIVEMMKGIARIKIPQDFIINEKVF